MDTLTHLGLVTLLCEVLKEQNLALLENLLSPLASLHGVICHNKKSELEKVNMLLSERCMNKSECKSYM